MKFPILALAMAAATGCTCPCRSGESPAVSPPRTVSAKGDGPVPPGKPFAHRARIVDRAELIRIAGNKENFDALLNRGLKPLVEINGKKYFDLEDKDSAPIIGGPPGMTAPPDGREIPPGGPPSLTLSEAAQYVGGLQVLRRLEGQFELKPIPLPPQAGSNDIRFLRVEINSAIDRMKTARLQ